MFARALALALSVTPALADAPGVVADIRVTGALVDEVLGELGRATVLVEGDADPHHFQLRPSQARAISDADLLVWVGPDLTPWLDRAVAGGGPEARVTLLRVPGTGLRSFGAHGHERGNDDRSHGAPAHSHAQEEDGDDGHHGAVDPHGWLDPANAAPWLAAIAAALAEVDPENAETYRANAGAAAQRIAEGAGRISERLAPFRDRPFVVFHDAYGYFEAAFGVTIAGSVALGDATDPGARRLGDLRRRIAREGITCLFREPQHSPAASEALARDTGARLGTLDPLGTTLADGPDFYLRLLEAMADDIARCLSGTG